MQRTTRSVTQRPGARTVRVRTVFSPPTSGGGGGENVNDLLATSPPIDATNTGQSEVELGQKTLDLLATKSPDECPAEVPPPLGKEERDQPIDEVAASTTLSGSETGDMPTIPPANLSVVRRGRPRAMDDVLQGKVCLLLSLGFSRRQAAFYLDIVHSTIANTIERDPDFARAVERAEQLSVMQPLISIAAAAQKNWRAAIWLMERNLKQLPVSEEERQRERTEQLRREEEHHADRVRKRQYEAAETNAYFEAADVEQEQARNRKFWRDQGLEEARPRKKGKVRMNDE